MFLNNAPPTLTTPHQRMHKVTKPREKKNKRSRSGCVHCKNRKKKCDEIQPICTGCYKRNLECHYTELDESDDPIEDQTRSVTHVSCIELLGTKYLTVIDAWSRSELTYVFPLEMDTSLDALELDFDLSTDTSIKLPTAITKRQLQYLLFWQSTILPELSVLPDVSNHFCNIYLRLALSEKAVLYCLICWGCRAQKGHSVDYQVRNEEYDSLMSVIRVELCDMHSDLTKHNFFACFVCYMALVTMEISFGDTRMWARYFNACFQMINKMPGCFKYLTDCGAEGWIMAQNFAYLDILASQTNENGTFYPIAEYVELLSLNGPQSDPMQGCTRPMNLLIGKTISLLVEYNALKVATEYPHHDRYSVVSEMLEKANNLDNEISFCKPDLSGLILETKGELEYHLTLFETVQIATQLYLRLVIKNLPAVVPEVELLCMNLKDDINVLINAKRFKKSLSFPMLMLGLCVANSSDRADVRMYFEELIKMCGYLSTYQSIWMVIQRVWESNNHGQVYVDWFKISREMEWKLNLAR